MGRARIKIMSLLKQAQPIIIFNQYLITSILLSLTMSTMCMEFKRNREN